MKASIRRFHSPDVWDLPSHKAGDPEWFGFLLQVMVGPADGPGEDSFDIVVCSPRWFADRLGEGEIRTGRHHLFMHRFDWDATEAFLRAEIESYEEDTWEELGERIGRLGRWEFEDYQPYEGETV
ncbi:MAG: Imm8 family immunity protein [Acidimicrobiia bacterium]